jgi:hypothetical protein
VPACQIQESALSKALQEPVEQPVQQAAKMREDAQSTNHAILREILLESADQTEAAA